MTNKNRWLTRTIATVVLLNSGLAVAASNSTPTLSAGSFSGVDFYWKANQEAKDQWQTVWKVENRNSYDVQISYRMEFRCRNGSTHLTNRSLSKVRAGASEGGQFDGMWSYACNASAPVSARPLEVKVTNPEREKREREARIQRSQQREDAQRRSDDQARARAKRVDDRVARIYESQRQANEGIKALEKSLTEMLKSK